VCGIILTVVVTAASVQDRDGAVPLIHAAHRLYPTIDRILVDGAYVGEVVEQAEKETGTDVEVTKRERASSQFCARPISLGRRAYMRLAWTLSSKE
jgi:hypothetical protein